MIPERETFWNIQFTEIFYVLSLIAVVIFIYTIYKYYRRWRLGRPADRFDHPGRRILDFLTLAVIDGLIHRKFFGFANGLRHRRFLPADLKPKEFYPGLIHLLIFIGCILLFLGTALENFNYYLYPFNRGSFYLGYSVATDAGGIMAIIGVILAMVRRYGQKPDRLDNRQDDLVALLLILAVVLTGFTVEGLRIAATELRVAADWAPWSPGGYVLALAFSDFSQGTLLNWHAGIWWSHSVLSLGAIIYVCLYYSKLFHIIWDPVNIFFRSLKPRGALTPIDFEAAEIFGVTNIEDFTWKQLLDLDACTRCGRCQDACPAYASGKALNPKQVIQDLKNHLDEVLPVKIFSRSITSKPGESRKDMITEVITEEVIWDCTTCRACQQVCPIYIEHIDKIIDMRRNLTMERNQFPELVQDVLKSLGARGHPYRGTTTTRTDWSDGLEIKTLSADSNVDVLYWVGCSAALDDRNMKVARATASILQKSSINFGILGMEESCCGDPARRMGDEYLFQTICQNNIELLKGYNVKKILTTCPHCFNTFKNEYPQFGGNFEVIHHTQFLTDLIRQDSLKPGGLEGMKVVYHDPCYLGRYNDIYQKPREILKAIDGLKSEELARCRENSFCCGGGGGHLWMEEKPDRRVNERRVQEIIDSNVDIVATACPYCLTMVEDGLKSKEANESIKAMDLSELVVESLGKNILL
ncbi:heterodisulfide reductase-related iron-sulfur binding cluster [Chloroflexota bacterium]